MKQTLAALIRLQSWRCEDGRRAVAAAQAQVDTLHLRRDRLAETQARERDAARALSATVPLDMTAYARRVTEERATIADALCEADAALAAARDDLARALGERRKLERAEADRRRAEVRAEDRRQRAALDEIALHRHARLGRTGPV